MSRSSKTELKRNSAALTKTSGTRLEPWSEKRAQLPLHPSVKLSPEEMHLLMEILNPLRYARNTLTLGPHNNWMQSDDRNQDSMFSGILPAVNGVLSVLHTYRCDVASGPDDVDLAFLFLEAARKIRFSLAVAPTDDQQKLLLDLINDADAEKLCVVEAYLIVEISKILKTFLEHLENLPATFSDFPGMFPSKKRIAELKKGIFNPVRWNDSSGRDLTSRFLSLESTYTYLRQGLDCPELIGSVMFLRVESFVMSGVTRLNGMTKHDLARYGFESPNDEFAKLIFSLRKPVNQDKRICPVDITTIVVRYKNCSRKPNEILPPEVLKYAEGLRDLRGALVLVPEEHMSVGIRVQWHVFGFGNAYLSSLWPHRLRDWSQSMSRESRLLFDITFQNDTDFTCSSTASKLTEHSSQAHEIFADEVTFLPSLFLYSML